MKSAETEGLLITFTPRQLGLIVAAFLTMTLAGGCSRSTPPELAQRVFMQELENVPADFVACISIDGKDADAAMLRDLNQSTRILVPASECEWVMDVSKGSYQRSSGKKAMLLSVTTNLLRSEVDFTARHSGLWGTTMKLQVSKSNGAWRIVRVLKEEHA